LASCPAQPPPPESRRSAVAVPSLRSNSTVHAQRLVRRDGHDIVGRHKGNGLNRAGEEGGHEYLAIPPRSRCIAGKGSKGSNLDVVVVPCELPNHVACAAECRSGGSADEEPTAPAGALKEAVPVSDSTTRAVLSRDPVTMCFPSWEKATSKICPRQHTEHARQAAHRPVRGGRGRSCACFPIVRGRPLCRGRPKSRWWHSRR
jgi:hypothetical protein